ncbi:MAG TPA: hypothetical protein VFN73_02395 [Propionibacteriaceae bacterium]|nr:hypothetical protein [Propionibacteriaceae bacterium]
MTIYQRSELGLSASAIQTQLRHGELVRVRLGGYADATSVVARERHLQLIALTVPWLAPGTVISHVSAGVLHGLPVPDEFFGRVTATRQRAGMGGGNSSPSLHTFALPLQPADCTVIDGVPVTSKSRTAADLARLLRPHDAVVMLDGALHDPAGGEGRGIRDEISRHLAEARTRRGAARAIRSLARADGRAESPLESLSRLMMRECGLPLAELQMEIRDASGRLVGRGDFGWRDARVIGECDGRIKYRDLARPGEDPLDVLMREKRRENQIQALGWTVVRWTWDDLAQPRVLCHRLGSALGLL